MILVSRSLSLLLSTDEQSTSGEKGICLRFETGPRVHPNNPTLMGTPPDTKRWNRK